MITEDDGNPPTEAVQTTRATSGEEGWYVTDPSSFVVTGVTWKAILAVNGIISQGPATYVVI